MRARSITPRGYWPPPPVPRSLAHRRAGGMLARAQNLHHHPHGLIPRKVSVPYRSSIRARGKTEGRGGVGNVQMIDNRREMIHRPMAAPPFFERCITSPYTRPEWRVVDARAGPCARESAPPQMSSTSPTDLVNRTRGKRGARTDTYATHPHPHPHPSAHARRSPTELPADVGNTGCGEIEGHARIAPLACTRSAACARTLGDVVNRQSSIRRGRSTHCNAGEKSFGRSSVILRSEWAALRSAISSVWGERAEEESAHGCSSRRPADVVNPESGEREREGRTYGGLHRPIDHNAAPRRASTRGSAHRNIRVDA
ncbi:hypothetical protein DFH09DRAFT_1097043 [Mycena vulgaris]|nr:hypothetical protein DFH09DRAFT_1097043 [Mycena vulgaris]